MGTDDRRVYYDHESAYRRIAACGGRGWDDICPNAQHDSYLALETFIASSFAPPRGTRALELGCGGGQASLRLARAGYRTTGVDFSETAIELARDNARIAGLDVEFVVDDCLHLRSQRDASIGLVVDNHALHCVIGAADRAAFLASAVRVLTPGGVLFSDTMTCDGGFDAAAMNADPTTRISANTTRFWVSEAELAGELAAAGLGVRHRERRPQDDGAGDMLVTYAVRA